VEASDPAPPPARRSRSRARRLVVWLAALLAVLLVLLGVGIPLPLGPFRGAIESRASDALGRDVRVGALDLVFGIRPRLVLEDVHLAHVLPDRPEVLRVERMELGLALAPLIGRRVHVRRARVDGVAVRIDPEAFPRSAPEVAASDAPATPSLASWSLDLEELALSRIEFELHRPDLEPLQASLERLSGRLLWDDALELAFSGRFRGVPVSAQIEGASVAALIEGAQAWPLRLAADLAGSPIELTARLATVGAVYRIEDMQGRAGETRFSGWLALENLATKPRATGRIEVGAVELEFPDREPATQPIDAPAESQARRFALRAAAPPTGRAEGSEGEEDAGPAALFIAMLRDAETDLEFEVARIAGIGPTLEDLSVALRVSGGELRFPVALTADAIPMSGTLRVDSVEEVPRLVFQLAAQHFRVDQLAATLLPNARIEGSFEELRLELEGRGDSLLGFLETLRIDLRMADAALTYGVERPVPFGVKNLELALAERGPVTLRVQGDLLGEAVGLDLSGGTMETFLGEEPWALRLEARGAGAKLELSGDARGYLDQLDLLGNLRIHGDRLSSLEPWLGTLPVPDAPYSIRARIDDTPDHTRVKLEEVRLGETNLVGELGERRGGDEPLLWATLRIESLDVSPYAEAVRRPRAAGKGAVSDEDEGGVAFDAPILPGGVAIRDADFDLGIGRLVAGDLELAELHLRGAFRDGFLPGSDFGFRLGAASFDGTTRVDLREPPHAATFAFGTREVDVGRLLSTLGVAEGVDSHAGALRIEVSGEGATLGDVLQQSDLMTRLEDVRWTLRDPNSQADFEIVLDRGELTSPRGDEPIRLVAEGSLKGVPVRLSMQTEQLSFFRRPEERIPLDLRLEMAGATLEVSSAVSLPIERSELDLALTLEGQSLDGASPLFEYELPPIGPYRLASRMRLTPQDYRLEDFELRVARSQLRGSGRLDLRGARPRIEFELASDRIQLDDFAAAFEAPAEAEARPSERAASWTDASRYEGHGGIREFWSPEGLLGFDARFVARVAQVLSGEDDLGRGELVVNLENGRLALDPLHLEIPGGPFELRTEYAYVVQGSGHAVEARIRANTEQFDYGPLARRVDPETDMQGWISLDLDVAGRAPESRTLLAHADGKLDFLAAPENIDADVFDLWAVSLLRYIVPRLDPGPRSTLNCVVARFDLEDGIMDERALLLDTTGLVVRGDARVDFRDERFRAVLTPAPKQGEILSLQTRVEVKGHFDDFRIGVPMKEVFATVVRFVTSIVVAPYQRLIGESLPADGEETCLAAWQEGKE
jgi:uncharacterized protein involved in outer membrane biogenesis